jgi:hypothetical protein
MRANTEALHFNIHGRVMIRVDAGAMPDAGVVEHEHEHGHGHESAVTEMSVRVMRGLR